MFERETRREKILEAVDLNKEMQLRMKNKSGFLTLLNKVLFLILSSKIFLNSGKGKTRTKANRGITSKIGEFYRREKYCVTLFSAKEGSFS